MSDISGDSVSFTNTSPSFSSGYYVVNYQDTLIATNGVQRFGKLIKGSNHAQLWITDSSGCEDSVSIEFKNSTGIQTVQEIGVVIPSQWLQSQSQFVIESSTYVKNVKMDVYSIAGRLVYHSENLPAIWSNKPAAGVYVVLLTAEMQNGTIFTVSQKLKVE